MNLDHLIGKTYVVNGQIVRITKAGLPTPEQTAATLERQAACKHTGGLNYTDPLTCAQCGQVIIASLGAPLP